MVLNTNKGIMGEITMKTLIRPLVENAVKHGIYPKRDGGVVSIDIRKTDSHFVISVVDNGIGIQFEKST